MFFSMVYRCFYCLTTVGQLTDGRRSINRQLSDNRLIAIGHKKRWHICLKNIHVIVVFDPQKYHNYNKMDEEFVVSSYF